VSGGNSKLIRIFLEALGRERRKEFIAECCIAQDLKQWNRPSGQKKFGYPKVVSLDIQNQKK
jgi:hypothetical protein